MTGNPEGKPFEPDLSGIEPPEGGDPTAGDPTALDALATPTPGGEPGQV